MVAKDFGGHNDEGQCIQLQFEMLESLYDSPKREDTKSYDKPYIRSPYNYSKDSHSTHNHSIEDRKNPTSKYKTASLRRKENFQNMPMPIEAARARLNPTYPSLPHLP